MHCDMKNGGDKIKKCQEMIKKNARLTKSVMGK